MIIQPGLDRVLNEVSHLVLDSVPHFSQTAWVIVELLKNYYLIQMNFPRDHTVNSSYIIHLLFEDLCDHTTRFSINHQNCVSVQLDKLLKTFSIFDVTMDNVSNDEHWAFPDKVANSDKLIFSTMWR